MLGMIVAQVGDSGLPVDKELTSACAVDYPIKVHINRFRSFLLDGVVGKAAGGGVVDLDFCGRLWVTQFAE